MENSQPTNDSQNRFYTLASGFKPKLPLKLALMLPFKNQIEGLLAKRASYDDIRLLLEDVNVVVSKNTIYRFCHQVIGHQSVRRRDQASPKEITPLKISPVQPSIQAALQEQREQIPGPWSRRKPGPRIANSKNL
jgi:hypothetical protein